eukprot:scaffold6994_cov145-Skeletonema_dohrnii-CCMP3373.AAC.8
MRTSFVLTCTKSAANKSAAYERGDRPNTPLRLSRQLPRTEKYQALVLTSSETRLMNSAKSKQAK